MGYRNYLRNISRDASDSRRTNEQYAAWKRAHPNTIKTRKFDGKTYYSVGGADLHKTKAEANREAKKYRPGGKFGRHSVRIVREKRRSR